ncbi:hypothetical protein AMECASPLE_036831 [Ameca splendens]|uniref:Uncharacterized protein n=1 Tax=Ameca splendens TaxID=208324 RepID=A0ABV0Y8D6_9TELE
MLRKQRAHRVNGSNSAPSGFSQRETLGQEDHCMLEQLSYKTEDLVQKILKLVPTERISAQEAMQHPYFSTLPAPIMHLRDTVSIFKVSGVRLETEGGPESWWQDEIGRTTFC